MGSIGCPLCCRDDFISVVALHDHLLYYVYRPLQCAICSTQVGGIQELTHHLQRHLEDSSESAIHQTKGVSDELSEGARNIPSSTDAFAPSLNFIKENPAIAEQGTSDFYSPHDKTHVNCGNNNFISPSSREEPIELTLRAYFCQTCGAKVVGKDAYFLHIKQHTSRQNTFVPSGPSPATSSSCHQELSSSFWNECGPSNRIVASVNSTSVNLMTDSETVTSEDTHEALGSPEAHLSDCMDEHNVDNQLLKLREWQLGKHGRRFKKHQLSFSSSPRHSVQSPMSEKFLCSASNSTIIDPGSVERQPLSQISGPASVDRAFGSNEAQMLPMTCSSSSFTVTTTAITTVLSPVTTTTSVLHENTMDFDVNTPTKEITGIVEHTSDSKIKAIESENILSNYSSVSKEQIEVSLPAAVEEEVPLDDCILSPLDNECVSECLSVGTSIHTPLDTVDVPVSTSSENKCSSSVFASNSWISPHHPAQYLELEPARKAGSQLRSAASDKQFEKKSLSDMPSLEKSTVSTTNYVRSHGDIADVPVHSDVGLDDSLSRNAQVPVCGNSGLSNILSHSGWSDISGNQLLEDLSSCITDGLQKQGSLSEDLTNVENIPVVQNASSETDVVQATSYEYPRDLVCSDDVVSDPDTKIKSCSNSHDDHPVDSRPYLHKKFHHDQERKVVSTGGIDQNVDVSRYIHSFQSLLVSKLNGTLSTELPLKRDRLCIKNNEISNRDASINSDCSKAQRTLLNEYVCEVCNVKCTSRSSYKTHYKLHEIEGQKNFQCQYCDKKFFRKRTKDLHLRKHTGEKTHRCEHCPQVFTKLYTFQRHQKEVHAAEKSFICAECGKGFSSQRQLENHIGVHQSEKVHKCSDCNHACHTASGLRTHRLEVHSKVQQDQQQHHCEECNESFNKKSGLKRHILRKHSTQHLRCDLCPKVYSCNEDLLQHRKTHNTEPLRCDHCEKTFTSSWSLQRHSVSHEKSTHPFKCTKCPVTFTRLDSLTCHLKLHAQKKMYICHCGSSFVKKSQLKAHEDKHSVVPKYNCTICSRAFKFKISLKNHSCKAVAALGEEN